MPSEPVSHDGPIPVMAHAVVEKEDQPELDAVGA